MLLEAECGKHSLTHSSRTAYEVIPDDVVNIGCEETSFLHTFRGIQTPKGTFSIPQTSANPLKGLVMRW